MLFFVLTKGRMQDDKPSQAFRVKTSAYIPLVGGSHMTRSNSGAWTLISPMEGHRSEWMLAEQQIPPPGAYGVSFTSGLYK